LELKTGGKIMREKKFMEAAIESAYRGIENGDGGPFGACIVFKNKIIATAHNEVLKNNDATCHAEINAIKIASEWLDDWNLTGCRIYTTTEACPMCFSAIHWSQIEKIAFGTKIEDVKRLGFNELSIGNLEMKKLGQSHVKIKIGFMRKECLLLLRRWKELNGKVY